jgi:hypothetical protein
MDYNVIAPIIKDTIQDVLSQKVYPFGFAKYRGLSNKVASGKLKNSVQVNVIPSDTKPVIQILMEDYWVNVQNGRRPKPGYNNRREGQGGGNSPFLNNLMEWIKSRGLQGRDKKGRFITRKSFAFAIRTNINKFGIRPTNFLDTAFNLLDTDKRIIEALGQEGFDELVNSIEGI